MRYGLLAADAAAVLLAFVGLYAAALAAMGVGAPGAAPLLLAVPLLFAMPTLRAESVRAAHGPVGRAVLLAFLAVWAVFAARTLAPAARMPEAPLAANALAGPMLCALAAAALMLAMLAFPLSPRPVAAPPRGRGRYVLGLGLLVGLAFLSTIIAVLFTWTHTFGENAGAIGYHASPAFFGLWMVLIAFAARQRGDGGPGGILGGAARLAHLGLILPLVAVFTTASQGLWVAPLAARLGDASETDIPFRVAFNHRLGPVHCVSLRSQFPDFDLPLQCTLDPARVVGLERGALVRATVAVTPFGYTIRAFETGRG